MTTRRRSAEYDNQSGGPRKPRVAGFSLLEVLLVLVLMAILASVSIGRFSGAATRQGFAAASGRLVADVELARQTAVSLGRSQTVTFTKTASSYTLDGMPDINRPGQTYSVALGSTAYGCTIKSVDVDGAGGSVLTFDAYGKPVLAASVTDPDARLSIVLSGAGRTVSIVVNASTGRTSVE